MTGKYYKTKETVDEYIQSAKNVDGKRLIKKLEQVLRPGSTLLEIGSGPGTDWKILTKSYKVTGSDNSTEFLNRLISDNPRAEFLELDAITLMTDQKFDGIYSNKVMHHLTDNQLVESITRQHNTLRPKGIICHSFWRGKGAEFFGDLFVNYHDEAALKGFCEKYFKILSINAYKEFEEDDSLLLLAEKK